LAAEKFDVVLMDVQMPEMDGFEATAAIRRREQETGDHIPIIAITAHAMKEDCERCLRAGMDHYVSKPIRGQALAKAMEEALSRCRNQVGPDEPLSPPAANSSCPAEFDVIGPSPADGPEDIARPAESEPIDWEAALAGFDGNGSLLELAARTFLEEHSKLIGAVHEAVERNDIASLRLAAHTCKGALRYFGSTPALDCALRLERAAATGTMEGAAEIFAGLDRAVAAITPALRRHLENLP
jgi:CheY-like chemotaxis protein